MAESANLSQVKVVSIRPVLHHVKNTGHEKYQHEEEVELRYEKIRWEYLDGNIAAEDEWNKRTA